MKIYKFNNAELSKSLVKGNTDPMSKIKSNIALHVTGNVERSLRQLKKKIEREGIVRDMKRIVYFEPPTQKRRKRHMRAVKQNYMRLMTNSN